MLWAEGNTTPDFDAVTDCAAALPRLKFPLVSPLTVPEALPVTLTPLMGAPPDTTRPVSGPLRTLFVRVTVKLSFPERYRNPLAEAVRGSNENPPASGNW